MEDAKQTREFFARWGVSFEELCSAFRDEFAPACVWDQRPIPRITGPDAAVRFLHLSARTLGLATIDVEICNIAVAGDVVHTERVDTLRRADGAVIVSAPVAGVLTYRDGQMVYWREYFDAGSFVAGIVGNLVATASRRLSGNMPRSQVTS